MLKKWLKPAAGGAEQGLIDVRELITSLSDDELLEAANHYFAALTVESEQCYKPFSSIRDAVHMHRNLALVLQAAELFRGAEVLDFGCGTGWLTLSMASLGCVATGVDVAQNAVRLANEWKERRGVRPGGEASFLVYDGHRLPLADASIDRIICFDAFHHVRDQGATLREFARVLRPGGRIAMLEPGPHHSKTPQSQKEMSQFKVIENDVDMQLVAAAAFLADLEPPTMLVPLQQPMVMPIGKYLQWAQAGRLPEADGERLLGSMARQLTNLQCFYITKPGDSVVDSRHARALACQLSLLSAKPAAGQPIAWVFRVGIRNVGEAVWRTSEGAVGKVNLGLQLVAGSGAMVDENFRRFGLGEADVPPGAETQLEFTVVGAIPQGCSLRFDLVAEYVCWFSENGRSAALTWTVGEPV